MNQLIKSALCLGFIVREGCSPSAEAAGRPTGAGESGRSAEGPASGDSGESASGGAGSSIDLDQSGTGGRPVGCNDLRVAPKPVTPTV
ncbi:MAG TPA: hypothetical protein VER33_27985, partial [Polyangiaceae bacterium]|nr:hypothetical protein [Polyangiaceae bacterium]